MKYLFGLLAGVLLGAASAGTLIYFNPLILDATRSSSDATAPLRYSLSGPGLLMSTHNRFPGVPVAPAPIQQLWERGLRGSWLQSYVIDGENAAVPAGAGAAAVATRFVVPSPQSNAISAGLLTEDQWLITIPGAGSLLALGSSNVWPLLRDSVVHVDLLGRDWAGPAGYSLLQGGTANIVGLTGTLSNRGGTLSEIVSLRDYPLSGFAGLSGQLDITLDAER